MADEVDSLSSLSFHMRLTQQRESYDVAIIGAGIGGLTAAALLAKAGLKVCVLEKEPHVGGYLAGFHRKGFRFDTAIHWLNQCEPGGLVYKIFDILGDDYPVAVPQKRIRRYKGNGFDYLLTNDPDKLKEQLIRDFPHEKTGIERFFKAAKRVGFSFKNFSPVFRSEETMNAFEKMKSKFRLLRFVMPFIPYVRFSGEKGFKKGLSKFFKDEKLQSLFASDTEVIGCLVPIGWAYYGDFQSPPPGGGQVIPEWLEHHVESYDGHIFKNTVVEQINLEGTKCVGVKVSHKGVQYNINAGYIVAASDLETLYEKMLPDIAVPLATKKKLKEAVLYSSSVTVSIALDCHPSLLGFDEELVHLVDEKVPFDDHHSGDPRKTEISILAPSLRDPTLAPEGRGTLVLFMPSEIHYEDAWCTKRDEHGNYIRGEAYIKLKNEIAGHLINRVAEKLNIPLAEHILFYDVATPVTHWRYTGNKNGSMMGTKPGQKNMQNKVARYHTAIENLYIGGHWAELGGGVPIAAKAGANAALLVLKKERRELFHAICAYMDDKLDLGALRNLSGMKEYNGRWVPQPTPAEKLASYVQK